MSTSDRKIPSSPPTAPPRRWERLEPPPPRAPDAVIIPDGQLADILPDGLVDAVLEQEELGVGLDVRWRAARDAFLASMGARWGDFILRALSQEIARRRDGAQESAKDLRQKVLLVLCRHYERHVAQTGQAWAPDDPAAYLRGVSRNVVRNHVKAKARKPPLERGLELDEIPDAVPDPDEARYVELLATFERERERGNLTSEEAEVFECRVSLGMTFPAISAAFQRPISTVKTQFGRAVATIRALVSRASEEPPAQEAGDAGNAGTVRGEPRT